MKKILKLIAIGLILAGLSTFSLSSDLKDGIYRAEYKKFDKYGWRQFLDLEIKNGTIASANFDYINRDGNLKSQDLSYNKRMKDKSGTSPKEFTPLFEKELLDKQSIEKLDGVAGATHSFQDFRALAEIILKNAKQGKTEKIILD